MRAIAGVKVRAASGFHIWNGVKGGRVQETMDIVRAHGGVVAGVAMVVDRSNGTVDFGVPTFSLLKMNVETFAPDKLPPDVAKAPAVKPGSK